MRRVALTALLFLGLTGASQAQTIYPLDRADILSGSVFDLKVEFAGAPAAGDVKVTINGKDAAEALGTATNVVVQEDGGDHTAYWIRKVAIKQPGTYTVEARQGDKSAKVTWTVYAAGERKAKNVILFIGDGLSVAHRTAARILSKGIKEGQYGGDLAMDDMPQMALVSTAGTDSIITDSANSMSAYTTGHKSCTNALGVYCARNKKTLDHPTVETIAEAAKRVRQMAVGVVTNTEIEDATPAGMVAHTRRRSDYNDIVEMFHKVQPDVILGGGSPNFLPKSTPGSKRTDEVDYIKKFEESGYTFVSTKTELAAATAAGKTKVLGLFNTGNIDGALDLKVLKKGSVSKFPDQPDLVDQTRAALDALAKSPNGFVLMVESGRIDKYSHSLDWERAVYDTIMLDNAVQVAKDFAQRTNDTMIIVIGDHTHPVSIIGTYDDTKPGQLPRDRLGVYAEAKFPNYPVADKDGYPAAVDVSRRIAFNFGSYPDHCFSSKPHLDGEFVPSVKGPDDKTQIANDKYCVPGAARITGNLPPEAQTGVHAGDDVIVTAMGPGSEMIRGHMPNVRIFKAMVTALGLGQ